MGADLTRALTGARPIKFTSPRCPSAWQPNHGRRSTYRRGKPVQTTGATSYALLLDALNRHRGKGQQKVTVEHVHVHSGGQAIVGMVERGTPANSSRTENQHDAKQITHAPQPAMRSPDAERKPVPVSHAERPMSMHRLTI